MPKKQSGQIIIFHQPRFPWNSRGFPFQNATFLGEIGRVNDLLWSSQGPLPGIHFLDTGIPSNLYNPQCCWGEKQLVDIITNPFFQDSPKGHVHLIMHQVGKCWNVSYTPPQISHFWKGDMFFQTTMFGKKDRGCIYIL